MDGAIWKIAQKLFETRKGKEDDDVTLLSLFSFNETDLVDLSLLMFRLCI